MTGEEPGPVMFTPGRATPGGPPPPAAGDTLPADLIDDMKAHLSYAWAQLIEMRLTAIEDNTYDLAEQVRMLGHRVTVALLTTIAAIAALVAVAILGRG